MDDNQPTVRVQRDEGDSPTVRKPKREIVFNRYELQSELGKGGMGVVWLAVDQELNAKVALKFLREEMTTEADALKELKGEVIINRDLSHPNIIKTFDFVTNGRTSAISMEYVNGVNLHKLKKSSEIEAKALGVPAPNPAGFFEAEDIKQWVFQVCDAMDYAHRQRVVHRDLKPANLMLNERGEVKVGDFGIGRTVADTVNRVTKNAAGTPPYMSPQQTMGEKAVPLDDIYSIGATIYDLLTGDPPFFRGAIRDQTLVKVPPSMAERRKELGRLGKPIPPAWETTIAACLAKDGASRPPTARAIREMLEGKPMPRRAAAAATAQPAGRGKWLAAAAVVLLVAAGGTGYWWMTRHHPVAPGPAPAPAQTAAQDTSTASATQAPAPAVQVNLPSTPVAAPDVATQAASVPAPTTGPKRFIGDLVDNGKITQREGDALEAALRRPPDDSEKKLATRLVVDHSLSPTNWRDFTTLVPPADEMVAKLRPLLAHGSILENEFSWLHAALAGEKGADEKELAKNLVEDQTLTPKEWREQTDLYPQPFMEKIKPLVKAGIIVKAEGQWLRGALAGEKGDTEKILAGKLVEEKSITSGQWRARTAFTYALKDGVLDPAQLPPAIDLPLSATVSVRLMRIDPGTFIHGTPKEELGRRNNELPPERAVIAKPFYIGIYEVTQAQYTAIMPRSPSYWRGNPTFPIDQVDWPSVGGNNGFIAKLNGILAMKYGGSVVAALPTEDEWEYACRAGTQTSFNNGKNISNIDSDSALDLLANYNRAAGGKPKPVGSYQPNAWGLYDMHGNLSEWCQNHYIRGGSWQSNAAYCRAGWRTQVSTDASVDNKVGFRLVLRYKEPAAP
jgi:formylglycine-generating enzyme required for sulfatase activity/tRNA A-37 threonylcarbamoyl transferase component Bud32